MLDGVGVCWVAKGLTNEEARNPNQFCQPTRALLYWNLWFHFFSKGKGDVVFWLIRVSPSLFGREVDKFTKIDNGRDGDPMDPFGRCTLQGKRGLETRPYGEFQGL